MDRGGFAPDASRAAPGSRRRGRRTAGFSLIEMMIVVAILGIIASTAIPSFMRYVYKARRSEALVALQVINDLQTVHYGDAGAYSDSFEELGFAVEGGTLIDSATVQGNYYTYVLEGLPMNGVENGNYRVTATGDIDPSDAVLDIIVIENQLTVIQ